MNWLPVIAILILLIATNALFVAAEFATASSRRSRLARLADEGNRLAGRVLAVVEKPALLDNYIATCQIGITASSLILGYYGQSALSGALLPWFERWLGGGRFAAESFAATVILLALTGLQVLFGELVPKNIGVRYPERLATVTFLPVRWSITLFRPLIFLFNGSAALILRLFGHEMAGEHSHIHAPEEILLLVEESGAGGVIDFEERMLLENALQLRERPVRQIMVPRTQMLAADREQSCDALFRLLSDSSYSRLPLYEENIDHIVGLVHLRDLLRARLQDKPCVDVGKWLHPAYFVPESMPISQVFRQMQRERQQMAVVLDEYGGTAGMVTMEDLVEEVFGEIHDEFDVAAAPFEVQADRILVQGDVVVAELNEALGLSLPEDEATTVAGLVLSRAQRIPNAGEEVQIGDVRLCVERMEDNRVATVAILGAPGIGAEEE